MPSPIFKGQYADDGKAIREAARASVGHRCIRCGHPFQCGVTKLEDGVWSPCDEKCTHNEPVRIKAPDDLAWVVVQKKTTLAGAFKGGIGDWVKSGGVAQAASRILTVHHFDGNKANDHWWNLLPLCQVCHLSFQTRVNPEIPWLFEHSDWLKPYVAGFYAHKYLGKDLTREEVMMDLENLLALERLA